MSVRSGVRRICYLVADLLSPWHDDQLPEHLQFGEIEFEGFKRKYMVRTAIMSKYVTSPGEGFQIFEIVGPEHVEYALRAWRPRHLLLMEDLSLAFYPLLNAYGPFGVPQIHIDRTIEILGHYYAYLGLKCPRDEFRARIDRFLENQRTERENRERLDALNDTNDDDHE